jgi:hypothetical protein
MRQLQFLIAFLFISESSIFAQSTFDVFEQVNLDSLEKTVREFSGEDSVIVNGVKVSIQHRVSSKGNNLAADYLFEKLQALGIDVEFDDYRKGGRNVIGTFQGKTNPDSIILYGAHYDAVADYCADDNASGCAAVLEAARILTKNCYENTLVFAFWDEEERGLIGSKYYADSLNSRGLHVVAAVNNDMLGYDGNGDKVFDIHTTNFPPNLALKDTILYLLDTLKVDLIPKVINPGTNRSDHGSFWANDIPAVFLGESFIGGDPNPAYHSSADRISLFDMPYFHSLAKISIALVAELAKVQIPDYRRDTVERCNYYTYRGRDLEQSGIYADTLKNTLGCDSIVILHLTINQVNDSVSRNGRRLTSLDQEASYRWIRCDATCSFKSVDTTQEYFVLDDGSYAVELRKGSCIDTSECIDVKVSNVEVNSELATWSVYPNPSSGMVTLRPWSNYSEVSLNVFDAIGRKVYQSHHGPQSEMVFDLSHSPGWNVVQITCNNRIQYYRILIQ